MRRPLLACGPLLALACAGAPAPVPAVDVCAPAPALQRAAQLGGEGRLDRAARLLRDELRRCPGSDDVAEELVRLLVDLGRRREAMALAAARSRGFAARVYPALARLDAESPADPDALVAAARAAKDPASRQRLLDRALGALEEQTGEAGRVVHLAWRPAGRASDADRYLLSPDDRFAVQPVSVVPGTEAALAVRDLSPAHRGAARWLLLRGTEALPLRFLSPGRLLAKMDARHGAVVDLSRGEALSFESVIAPVPSPDGRLLAAVGADGGVRLLDAATLAERARARGVKLGEKPEEAVLTFPAPGRLLMKLGARLVLVDLATGELSYDAEEENDLEWSQPRVSPRGRYLAVARSAGVGVEVAVLDTRRAGRVVARAPVGMFVPAFAWSADEATFASSTDPAFVEITHLPTGAKRRLPTGRGARVEGYALFTDRLALSEDGRRACGHIATSIGKYTECYAVPYADLGRGGPAEPGEGMLEWCFIDGPTARFVSIPRSALDGGRTVLPSVNATYTRLCNQDLSPDGSTFTLADAAPVKKGDDTYHDVQLMLVDTREKKVRHRVPLGASPTVMGAILQTEFSPSGAYLRVGLGEALWSTLDVRRGARLPLDLPDGRFSPGERLFVAADDAATVAALDGGPPFALDPPGKVCAFGSLLAPFEVCEERER